MNPTNLITRLTRVTLPCILIILLTSCTGLNSAPEQPALQSATLLVTVAHAQPTELNTIQQSLAMQYNLVSKNDWPLSSLDIYCLIYELTNKTHSAKVIAAIEQDPRVDSVQLIRQFNVLAKDSESHQPATTELHYDDQHYPLQYGLKTLQADVAHQWSTGKSVKVGIVDTGIDANHKDLSSAVYTRSFVGKPSDVNFAETHGTAIAGIIAAKANNAIGIVGIAPDAELIGLRGCWQPEQSTRGSCDSLSLAKAIDYANIHKIDILNLSLQGPYDPIIDRLLVYAMSQNTAIIAAYQPSVHNFPASQAGVIAVTSEPGIASNHTLKSTLVAAPGTDILTTVPASQYDLLQGSSLAAAHISGVVALLRELQPTLKASEIAALLKTSSSEFNEISQDKMVNACQAVAVLLGKSC